MYLKPASVELCFSRLSSGKKTGKAPLEKTSALMYFLAFDASVKKVGKCPLDLNPNKTEGQNNRHAMELEFVRLVLLGKKSGGWIKQVTVLGNAVTGGSSPEKRISSNFFTQPLKKSSHSAKAYQYPSRPAPVLTMGGAATGITWGVNYFLEWKKNLPKLLSGVKSNTPFTDLAVFVCRHVEFQGKDLRAELLRALEVRFSSELAAFWAKQIEGEKLFFKHGVDPFQQAPSNDFLSSVTSGRAATTSLDLLRGAGKEALIERIIYLEGLLDAQEIEYQPIK